MDETKLRPQVLALVTMAKQAKERAATWRAESAKATPGPWTHAGGRQVLCRPGGDYVPARTTEDAVFIANARCALPEAADDVDALADAVVGLVADNEHMARLLEHKVQPHFGPFSRTEDGQIELPVRDAAGVGQFIFETFGGLLEGTFRGGTHAKNYVVLTGTSQVVGRIDLTIQRVGRVTPHEGRVAAEAQLACAVALLKEHGIAWEGETTFPPDEPPAIAEAPHGPDDHPEWCELLVNVRPNVLHCMRCAEKQEMPAGQHPAGMLQGILKVFADQHRECREGDAAKLGREVSRSASTNGTGEAP